VVRIKKDYLDFIDKIKVTNTKNNVLGKNEYIDDNGIIYVGSCETYTMKSGHNYRFKYHARISGELYIEEGVNLTLGNRFWVIYDVVCYDTKAFKKLLFYLGARVTNSLSIPENLLSTYFKYSDKEGNREALKNLSMIKILNIDNPKKDLNLLDKVLKKYCFLNEEELSSVELFADQYDCMLDYSARFKYKYNDEFTGHLLEEYFNDIYTPLIGYLNSTSSFGYNSMLHYLGVDNIINNIVTAKPFNYNKNKDYNIFSTDLYNHIIKTITSKDFRNSDEVKLLKSEVDYLYRILKKYNIKIIVYKDSYCILLWNYFGYCANNCIVNLEGILDVWHERDDITFVGLLDVLLTSLQDYRGSDICKNRRYIDVVMSVYSKWATFNYSDDFRAIYDKVLDSKIKHGDK
jgi:hypothetical protein